ncbi:MAG: hypothetical protein JSW55_11105 [Chloroflexota bacterium]|nr:MAG: hypothetical protein JSW55_11105 [Chloroflexota bacterium]
MMNTIWGLVLILFTLILCWLGQVVNAAAPDFAARIGLAEPESDVDRIFFLDGRGEAIWDALILWSLPVAGILLLLDSPSWAYFGLFGGGMYLYFAGRGLVVRQVMRRHDVTIGKPETQKLFSAVLILWGLIAVVTIIMATMAI